MLSPGAWASVAAIAVASTTLFYEFYPEKRRVAPSEIAGAVKIVAVEHGIGYGDFLLTRSYDTAKFRKTKPASRRLRGELLYVEQEISGRRNETTQLRWWIYDARTGLRVPVRIEDRLKPQGRNEQGTPRDQFIVPIWVRPRRSGRFFVRVELYTDNNVMLAMARSRTFRFRVERP